MSKPKIPAIENEEAVIEWFFQNDDKIQRDFFSKPENFLRIKNEILENMKNCSGPENLKAYVEKILTFYSEKILPTIANAKQSNKQIPNDMIVLEYVVSAKMRILGYFLLKKYNIQFQ